MPAVSEPRQALAGVTVLDLATYLAAPVCATLLGEFGADVVKVEQPRVGDDLRRLGRPVTPSAGGSYWWFVEARNKKSITCNLRDPDGQALIRRLVASAHVVTENFRPGTLERWHLGWSDLAQHRPSLVMVRISAFGQTGPNRERPGFGRIAAAVGGLAYVSGYPDRAPVSPGTPTVPDYLAGVFGAVGALVALRHAERTGEGQAVGLALYAPALRAVDAAIAVSGATGHARGGKASGGAGGGGGARLARRERARPLRGLPRARAPEHRVGRAAPARPARDAGSRPAVDADARTDRDRRAVEPRRAQRGDL